MVRNFLHGSLGNAGAVRDSRPGNTRTSPVPLRRSGEGWGEEGRYSTLVWIGASGWKAWKAKAKLMS